MPQMIAQRAFSTGELSPGLAARADLSKYATALRRCQNFMVQRHGGVANRPGTRYVAATKTTASAQQLMRYVSEVAGSSVLIECGDLYFRFFVDGAPVTVTPAAWFGGTAYVAGDVVSLAGVNYYCIAANTGQQPPNATYWYPMPAGDLLEIPHPFSAANRPRWVQSGSIITLTHPSVAPQELRYLGLTTWTVTEITTKPDIDAPTGLAGTESTDDTLWPYAYVVTAADAETAEESEPSDPWIVYRAVGPRKTEPFTLIFDGIQAAVKAQAREYYVYRDSRRNGVYGFLETAVWNGVGAFHFHDTGLTEDPSQTPPDVVRRFASSNNYPAMAAYFQQRRFFANSNNEPESVWGSRIGFPRNFGIAWPLQDDDAIAFRLAGMQRHPVQHLVGLSRVLVALTDAGEWIVRGGGEGPILPTAIEADQIAYWGASPAVPVVIGQTLIYVQTRGRIVRDLQLDPSAGGLSGRDLTLLAGHLFDGYTISKVDYAQNPHSIVWAIRSDGTLLGLTYVPDDDIWGWHRHDTGASGVFLDVCVVPEHDEDAVYLLVNRTIDGVPVRYIERMASRTVLDIEDAFFVDSGLSYDDVPTASVSGLDHLEGEVVAVLGDGEVVFNGDPDHADAVDFTVSAGAIALPASYSVIHVGLPIRYAEIETVDIDAAGTSVRDKRKRVQGLTMLVEKSAQVFQAGPDRDHLLAFRPESWQASSGLVDDALQGEITAAFTDYGRVVIRQTEPLPLTILGLFPTVQIGG